MMTGTTDSSNGSNGALQALSDALAAAVERAGRAVVAVHARRRIPASGVVWRPGIVVATHHTVRRDDNIQVTLADGTTVPAVLAGRDPSTDLAVLRLQTAGETTAERADEAQLRVGHVVLAVGRPGDSVTASLGAVSALEGEWRTWAGGRLDRFIRLDLAIYDGFSGGPLVDAQGRVLGIDTSGLVRGTPVTIPGATVDRVVDQLLERGHVRRAYLGLGMQSVRLPEALRRSLGLAQELGLMVVTVEADGPGDRAGILLGDVLVALDGTPVREPTEVLALLGPERVGKAVAARVVRAGAAQEITIAVGERPERGR